MGIVVRPEHHLLSVTHKYIILKLASKSGLPTAAYHTLSNSIEKEASLIFENPPELDFERHSENKEAAYMRCDFAEP